MGPRESADRPGKRSVTWFSNAPAPFLIYRESDSVVRALRDYLTNDIGEILIDDESTYKDAVEHVKADDAAQSQEAEALHRSGARCSRASRLNRRSNRLSPTTSICHRAAASSSTTRKRWYRSTSNSARATKGGDIEATALNTNLEAADEIARQLRIRDLGGLVVIDFIDMGPQKPSTRC